MSDTDDNHQCVLCGAAAHIKDDALLIKGWLCSSCLSIESKRYDAHRIARSAARRKYRQTWIGRNKPVLDVIAIILLPLWIIPAFIVAVLRGKLND